MQRLGWVTSFLVVAILLSGCSGGSKSSTGPSSSPSPTGGSNETYEDPFADFFVSPNFGVPGQTLRFDASKSSDPEGGNLSFAWDFADGQAATGVLVEHAFAVAKDYRVLLNVTSDKSRQSAEVSLVVRVVDPATLKHPLVLTDPDSDGLSDQTDIVGATVYDSGGRLQFTITLQAVAAAYSTASPFMVDITLNDLPFEVYGFGGEFGLYSFGTQSDVPDANIRIDPATNTILVDARMNDLGVQLPVQVFFESRIGEPKLVHSVATDDRVPDSGSATYPG